MKSETSRFECQCRKIIVTQGFIKPEWGTRMTSLDLTGNLIFHLPSFFMDFKLLTELLLANNDLCKIPRWIAKLQNLRILDFMNNSIVYIPDSLYTLQNLQTLNLSGNQITKVPLFLGHMPQLSVLSLANNPITFIPNIFLEESIYDSSNIITFLKYQLDKVAFLQLDLQNITYSIPEYFENYSLPDNEEDIPAEKIIENGLSNCEVDALNNRKNQILGKELEIPRCFTNVIHILNEPKKLSTPLEPECKSNCSYIAKISDSIWCGTVSGLIHIWDSRVRIYLI